MFKKKNLAWLIQGMFWLPLVVSYTAHGLVIEEDFRKKTTANNWIFPKVGGLINYDPGTQISTNSNFACLTAGDNTGTGNASTAGKPPKCADLTEVPGQGALRLTPAKQFKSGGIVSNFTFPTNDGVDITFTTYTYGGDGADGMSFALIDGAEPPTLGGLGGALGYSCPTSNYARRGSGMRGAYLGVGIDEWGNFLNRNDNSGNGVLTATTKNYIGLRGKGEINLEYLNAKYGKAYFPLDTAGQNAVMEACKKGSFVRREGGKDVTVPLANYKELANYKLSNATPIGSSATTRAGATPINYRLRITEEGLLSFWWSYNGGQYVPLLTDKDIIASQGAVPASFRFAFAGATGGSTNVHEVTCFKAQPASLSIGTSPSNTPDGSFRTDTQIFSSFFNSNYWSGAFTATTLLKTPTGGLVAENSANWDASCLLAGGNCGNTGGTFTKRPYNSRVFWTTDAAGGGIGLGWGQLDPTMQALLNAGDNQGQKRLEHLQGNTAYDGVVVSPSTSVFRKRKGILGDIIHAGTAVVGPPNKVSQYSTNAVWKDRLNGSAAPEVGAGAQTYAEFAGIYNTRQNIAYVGANDGFLHGFRAGAYDATGKKFIKNDATRPNDGYEVLAYMPRSVLSRIHSNNNAQDLSNSQYGHNYYHDSTPGFGDLFYQNSWHTWLVSGLGAGGNTIYAIDVTDPSYTTGNANTHIKGEWSYKAGDPLWKYLGNTYGKPEIIRLHNGQWGAVFGNGWCSSADQANGNCKMTDTGQAGIYLMLVDPSSGAISFKFLNTNVGTTANPNGIGEVTPVDMDKDNITDYVYAGDIQGNVWRFDLTGASASAWESEVPANVFSAASTQPITTKINVNLDNDKRVMLNFGTGKRNLGYLTATDTYANATQALYGIWDSQMSSWNSKGSMQYKSMPANVKPALSALAVQTKGADNLLSKNSVCWADSSTCSSDPKYGWYQNLGSKVTDGVTQYEQVINNPATQKSAVFFNTYMDGTAPVISCDEIPASGLSYGVDFLTGKGIDNVFDGSIGAYAMNYANVGDVTIILVDGVPYIQIKTSDGKVTFVKLNIPNINENAAIKRLSWREIF